MEKGISRIIKLLENEISDDKILLSFLKELVKKENFEHPAWYKDIYQKMIKEAIDSGWKNEN